MRVRGGWVMAGAAWLLTLGACDSSSVTAVGDDGGMDAVADVQCAAGQRACGTRCSALTDDPDNCGACGNACPRSQVCAMGQCRASCPSGQQLCDGRCVSVDTDRAHCGACGNACPQGEVCAMGRCALECGPRLALCATPGGGGDGGGGRTCADTRVDRAHCGACGRACAAGELCVDGACGLQCAAGQTACEGACRSLQSDPAHCGACGNACASVANGTPFCAAGQCGLACRPGFGDCDRDAATGCETALDTAEHCGACGRACRFANAAGVCMAGACQRGACAEGFGDCDGNPANGCEVDLQTDSARCGACGTRCPAGQLCSDGQCRPSCGAGLSNCDGVCRDLQTDNASCGACGTRCPAGTACAAGRCEVTCASGLTACGGACRNVDTDPAHCGACGMQCPSGANASPFCASRRCGIACNAGAGDCDGNAANGCEADLGAVSSCGACGVRCAFANASARCASGRCALGACNAGFLDCDGNAANGCEVDGRTDLAHCGACGARCGAGEVCSAGRCERLCGSGLTRCGATCVDLASDPAHCGACGASCPSRPNAAPRCASSACGYTCSAGFGDCDGSAANGCELDLRTDSNNCGACGRRCATGTCSAGSCTRLVFVTSTMHTGDLGGLAGADAICQARAMSAGLGGTWRAWLADATGSPATRFTRSTGPYTLVNGTVVANNWDDLTDGTLARPIDRTETGAPAPLGNTSCAGSGNRTAWSGVASNGTWSGATACGGWTSASGSGLWGQVDSTASWSSWCSGGLCSWVSPLYCFQQ